MTPKPSKNEPKNPAIEYQKFLAKMYERFGHDNGEVIDECSEVEVPAAFNFIRFRSRDELKFFDPSQPEFWSRGILNNTLGMKKNQISTQRLPPDPLNDEDFKRIQERVCIQPSNCSLLEQSIQRCDIPEQELEKEAEDIPTIEDSEDLRREIESLCAAFRNHCDGIEDFSEEEDDVDENEAARLRENTQNILEDLSKSEASEDTVSEMAEMSEIRDFRPRKSSTFLIPSLEESQARAANCEGEDTVTLIEATGNVENESGDHAEENKSSVLMIRVSCEESDSSASQGSNSAFSTPKKSDRSLMSVPEQGSSARSLSDSSGTPKQHPPLHLLTPLQRRLVKLNLY